MTGLVCLLILIVPGPVAAQELDTPVIEAAPAQSDAPPSDAAPGGDAATPSESAEAEPSGRETIERSQTGADADDSDAGVDAAQTDRDCADFSTQGEAQDYFDRNGGDENNNVDNLDADGDGIACENLPSGAPSGGVDTGGGATAVPPSGPAPLAFVLTGAGFGLLVGWVTALALRRRRGSA